MPVPSYLTELRNREVERALQFLQSLPSLSTADVPADDSCPICLAPYSSIFEEQVASTEEQESRSGPQSEAGSREARVVRLTSCGHVFCFKDLAEWVESQHGSCPACRQMFFEFTPIDEAEYESSDGGEYIPEEDEDDGFTDDGDLELIPTSDFEGDTDIDEEEEDIGASQVVPQTRFRHTPVDAFSGLGNGMGTNLLLDVQDERSVIHDNRGHVRDDAHREVEESREEVEDQDIEDCYDEDYGGPFYASEPSSEGTSYSNVEEATEISMTAEGDTSSGEDDDALELVGEDIKLPGLLEDCPRVDLNFHQ